MKKRIHSVKVFLHQLKRYFFVFRKQHVQQKVILLSSGRSGSNLLTSLLNSHPDIFFDNERFHEQSAGKIIFPELYINCLPRQTRCQNKNIYGVGLMTVQLKKYFKDNDGIKEFIQKLIKDHWKIIYLRRDNIFDSSISYRRGQTDSDWLNSQSGNRPIELKVQEVVDSMTYRLQLHSIEDYILENTNAYKVNYERDLKNANWQTLMDDLFSFLNVKPITVTTKLKKKTTKPPTETISNFEQLKEALIKVGYEHYLNES